MAESELQKQIVDILTLKGIRIFRNNIDKRGRRNYGLAPGSSDLIGWTRTGQFLAIEVKDGDSYNPSQAQLDFLADVNKAGGIGILARKLEDVLGL